MNEVTTIGLDLAKTVFQVHGVGASPDVARLDAGQVLADRRRGIDPKITSDAFQDEAPIYTDPDPFVIQFKVKPIVILDPETSLPIFADAVWNACSWTRGVEKGSRGWACERLRHVHDAPNVR